MSIYKPNDYRPDKVLAGIIRDQLLAFKEILIESGKQQDNIAVWLVGMSTGSIALIISQFGKFNPVLHTALKVGISFLTATIIFGLLFRILHLFLREQDMSDVISTNAWLATHNKFSSLVPNELPEDTPTEFIACCLYEQIGIEMTYEFYESLRNENDANIEEWRNRYEQVMASRHVLTENLLNYIVEPFLEFIADLEGLSSKELTQKFKQSVEEGDSKSSGIRKRRLKKSCKFFYILMCISFAVSVLFISCSFVVTDYKTNNDSTSAKQRQVSPLDQVQPTKINKTD